MSLRYLECVNLIWLLIIGKNSAIHKTFKQFKRILSVCFFAWIQLTQKLIYRFFSNKICQKEKLSSCVLHLASSQCDVKELRNNDECVPWCSKLASLISVPDFNLNGVQSFDLRPWDFPRYNSAGPKLIFNLILDLTHIHNQRRIILLSEYSLQLVTLLKNIFFRILKYRFVDFFKINESCYE